MGVTGGPGGLASQLPAAGRPRPPPRRPLPPASRAARGAPCLEGGAALLGAARGRGIGVVERAEALVVVVAPLAGGVGRQPLQAARRASGTVTSQLTRRVLTPRLDALAGPAAAHASGRTKHPKTPLCALSQAPTLLASLKLLTQRSTSCSVAAAAAKAWGGWGATSIGGRNVWRRRRSPAPREAHGRPAAGSPALRPPATVGSCDCRIAVTAPTPRCQYRELGLGPARSAAGRAARPCAASRCGPTWSSRRRAARRPGRVPSLMPRWQSGGPTHSAPIPHCDRPHGILAHE